LVVKTYQSLRQFVRDKPLSEIAHTECISPHSHLEGEYLGTRAELLASAQSQPLCTPDVQDHGPFGQPPKKRHNKFSESYDRRMRRIKASPPNYRVIHDYPPISTP